ACSCACRSTNRSEACYNTYARAETCASSSACGTAWSASGTPDGSRRNTGFGGASGGRRPWSCCAARCADTTEQLGPALGARESLPPLPDKMPSKAEPGKPLYTRKAPQRQRPIIDKREMEGERKLHPTRLRQGAGRAAAAAVIAPPEPRPPRDVTITEGITIRELAEKLDVRAKDLLKTLLDRGVFASINQA